jgi:hypothetical protein
VNQERQAESDRLKSQNELTPEAQKRLAAMGSRRLRFLCGLVITGFAIAALAWLAGLADVTENVGLLFFLKNPTPQSDVLPLQIAYWAATVKFWLIALAGIYAAIAFIFGAWKRVGLQTMSSTSWQKFLRIAFFLVSLIAIVIAGDALVRCRAHPENCQPPPKHESA